MKKICKRIAALLLGIVMLSNVLLVNAAEQYSDKIDADLQEVMEKAAEEELIEIWLWLDDPITDKMIEQMLLEERNITKPGEGATLKQVDEYIMARREIVKREHSAIVDQFLEDYVNEERKILYSGSYTTTIILEATKAEIVAYAELEEVNGISFYEDFPLESFEPEGSELEDERKHAICEDYLLYLNSSYWTLDDIIIEYYGTYSGCEIVWMSCKDLADTEDMAYLPIGNYMFVWGSGSAVERFYVYKEHEFIPVRNAYEQGLITDDDVEELAKKFDKRAYRIKWTFEDVQVDDWFCEGVHFCAQNGIMIGVDDEHFEPGRTITRAEFVAALYRLAGKPEVTKDNTFTDVPKGSYYEDAVSWCTEKKIVFGTTKETFSPNLPITREEIACLAARYAKFVGAKFLYDDYVAELGYRDYDKVSAYAKESVDIVRREALMVGDHNGMFNPQNPATRAEVALIFKKLVQYMDTDRGQWSKYSVNDYKGKGTVQTTYFDSEKTAKLRKLLDMDEKGWKEFFVPEYISKYELVLDDVIYHFESLDADPTLPIRCETVYGGKCYGMLNSDGTLLAQVYELLPSE